MTYSFLILDFNHLTLGYIKVPDTSLMSFEYVRLELLGHLMLMTRYKAFAL